MWSPLQPRLFSISSIRHFVIRLRENSLIPLLCIRASSSLPWSSTKLTFVKSTNSGTAPFGHVCQHLSNSSTHLPASLPSRKSLVTNDSCCAVILITFVLKPPATLLPRITRTKSGFFNPCHLWLKSLHDFSRCSTCYRRSANAEVPHPFRTFESHHFPPRLI